MIPAPAGTGSLRDTVSQLGTTAGLLVDPTPHRTSLAPCRPACARGKNDKREDRGPFTRHIQSLWGNSNYGKNSKRNTFGFGYVTSDRLAKGIAESIDTNYNKSAEEELNKLDRDFKTIMEE